MSKTVNILVGDKACELPALPDGGRGGGFAFGLHKAGSTMLYKALSRLAKNHQLQFINIVQLFRKCGVVLEREELAPATIEMLQKYMDHSGFLFGGWRDFPTNYKLPLRENTRTFLLIRDPRDMITSLYFSLKFSHRMSGPNGNNIQLAREKLEYLAIDEFALREAPHVVRKFEAYDALAGTALMLRRYEDIVFDKVSLVNDLCRHFEIDASQPRITRIAQGIDELPENENVHAHVRKVTPGDHKEKLQPLTIEKLNTILREVLVKYRYIT